ncbi:MAG: M1 family aminopeptidase [Candidatus Kapaibacterium sp.]
MIKQIILLLLVVTLSTSFAQELPEYLRAETKHFDVENTTSGTHYHKNNRVQDYGDVERRNYDVLHYDLYLDLKDALRSNLDAPVEERKGFSGENRMTVLLTSDVDSIEFDAANMKIGYSTVNGVFPDNVPVVENGLVKIYVGDHKAGDTINVSIYYTAIADDEDGFWRNRGMHIYHKGYNVGNKDRFDNPVIVEHNIAYSMSEPELARYWMPCNDRPYDKATSSMKILVPKGYTAVSNGYLADIEEQTSQSLKNTVLYSWINNEPIATYLMNFAASVFDTLQQKYIKNGDTIPSTHYFWPEDRDNIYFTAVKSMETHPGMMDILVDNYGTYPFATYGTVSVFPFPYGGMEHQTMVTQNRYWLNDEQDAGFVHEMGHHWFGNSMTCATWADIWINEGGASYTEAIYLEDLEEPQSYRNVIERQVREVLKRNPDNSAIPVYAIPLSSFFNTNAYLIYDKGSIIHNQMRLNLGDEQFFRVLKEILEEFKYKSITTAEYKDAWKEKAVNPLVDIDTFFEQWVYKPGYPDFEIKTKVTILDENKFDVYVNLNQMQKDNLLVNPDVTDVFKTPVRFKLYKDEDNYELSELFVNNEKNQTFYFENTFFPVKVEIDPVSVLHYTFSSVITSVQLEDYVGDLELYPNPSTEGISQLNMNIKNIVQNANIELIDLLGNKVQTIYNGRLNPSSIGYKIFTNGLAKGIYIVNINLDGVYTSKKLIIQ